jgi:RNA polymerase sigma factor (sigma-70 family)
MDAHALVTTLAPERARFVRLARQKVGSAADAEDIVQRALVRAAERASTLDDPSRARAWFYRILRNTIVDHHRASRGETARHTTTDVDTIAGTVTEAARTCTCGQRLLGELKPSYAELIRRIDVESESPSAVAAALGISRGNLEVRLHRARKSLRTWLEGYCGVRSHQQCLDCDCDLQSRCA